MKYEAEVETIRSGGIGVIPTDTIYGLVCSAFSPSSVERIYELKKRDPQKPFIVLINNLKDIEKFGIKPDGAMKKILKNYWPGPVSIILPCEDKMFSYIHRGTNGIAFRLPKSTWLNEFLSKTGPMVAPSANPEGQPPAKNIEEARRYFEDTPNFYIDGGELDNPPSQLLTLTEGGIKRLR